MSRRVVALGGGHGLASTLRALLTIDIAPTAIVGVADDGGSSGRIRDAFGVLPPGDLRMALIALSPRSTLSDLMQHRFADAGALTGHSLGNLVLAAAWQRTDDPVAALDELSETLGIRGRVLPVSPVPVTIHADVRDRNGDAETITGQHRIAAAPGYVERIWLTPDAPPPVPAVLDAISTADAVILGPGSWYTSVLPHLLIPQVRRALERTPAQRVLITNVRPRSDQETRGLPISEHIRILRRYAPDLRIDSMIVDPHHGGSETDLGETAQECGADVLWMPVEDQNSAGLHDPVLLGRALRTALRD